MTYQVVKTLLSSSGKSLHSYQNNSAFILYGNFFSRRSIKNSSRYFRLKGAVLEGQLAPFYENYTIDAETDDTLVMNPIISGEETLFADVVDQDKMDITR